MKKELLILTAIIATVLIIMKLSGADFS